MNTDRELLEAAAKAAGIETHGPASVSGLLVQLPYQGTTPAYASWDPLKDDGDALRLAVKLRLHLGLEDCAMNAWSPAVLNSWSTENPKTDPTAATRRAIVRAAAAIGSTA